MVNTHTNTSKRGAMRSQKITFRPVLSLDELRILYQLVIDARSTDYDSDDKDINDYNHSYKNYSMELQDIYIKFKKLLINVPGEAGPQLPYSPQPPYRPQPETQNDSVESISIENGNLHETQSLRANANISKYYKQYGLHTTIELFGSAAVVEYIKSIPVMEISDVEAKWFGENVKW